MTSGRCPKQSRAINAHGARYLGVRTFVDATAYPTSHPHCGVFHHLYGLLPRSVPMYMPLVLPATPAADHPITGSACGTSGRRELCRGGVPHERAIRLQAAGFGTIDVSLSERETRTRHRIANTVERTGRERMRFGYRRLTAMPVREGVPANHKRVYRLYREEGLAMRIRKRRRICWDGGVVKPAASQPNERWSMDLVSDA